MSGKIGVGIIGVGRRGYDLAECLVRLRDTVDLELRGLCNRTIIRAKRAKEDLTQLFSPAGSAPDIRVFADFARLIDDPRINVVMICTPQYAHKEPALLAIRGQKKVYVDKPLAHNLEDALAICRGQQEAGNEVIMSFTRRFEQAWIDAFDLVHRQGAIGKLRMIQVRNIIPYHVYFHTWHRRMQWSGGAIADKMSHIFDVFNWFSKDRPAKVSAFGGQAVFAADPTAPERCQLCERDCPYRVAEPRLSSSRHEGAVERGRPDAMVDHDDSRLLESEIIKRHDTCVWYPGADIDDHGIVSIEYEHGLKASLFWSLFGPDSDDQETLELVGDKGRIILTRHSATIDIVTDYGKTHKVLDQRTAGFGRSHFGADDNFILELDRFAKGAPPTASAREGLEASRIVEAVHRSIRSGGKLIPMTEVETT
ncbi:MAG TPA: Gfo/Idh/MocA family oxidoreductase [Spirochaetia bacterium]|nr:Gfo/Idh/MocA family oxidoreductase [Spirochaetia bacterium]